jgi:hypothetical protein
MEEACKGMPFFVGYCRNRAFALNPGIEECAGRP